MIGTKHISDLITDPQILQAHKINIIEADVSAGKTWFALTTLPNWTTKPNKILYLIDTSNGEYRIQRNILYVSRQTYSFYDYGKPCLWGERNEDAENNMPVMTYAGFGSEVRKSKENDKWLFQFDYIVCDEMQNLAHYQKFDERSGVTVQAHPPGKRYQSNCDERNDRRDQKALWISLLRCPL